MPAPHHHAKRRRQHLPHQYLHSKTRAIYRARRVQADGNQQTEDETDTGQLITNEWRLSEISKNSPDCPARAVHGLSGNGRAGFLDWSAFAAYQCGYETANYEGHRTSQRHGTDIANDARQLHWVADVVHECQGNGGNQQCSHHTATNRDFPTSTKHQHHGSG
ncbi:hypothetical protein D3C78_1145140 [compost metagenome]